MADSGHILGLEAKAKPAIISANPERFWADEKTASQIRDQR
jgi:hypothetical protein